MRQPFGLISALVIGALLLIGSGPFAHAATFVVNSTADTVDVNPGNGVCADASGACTLRAAIIETNALSGADVINLPAGTYALAIPGQGENAAATGDLDVLGSLTINGAGAAFTIIDGGGLDRVIEIRSGATVQINAVTVRNGNPGVGSSGGGILNFTGTLTLNNTIVSGNTAALVGGGMVNESGTTILDASTVSGNTAGSGGGIYNHGPMTLTRSTMSMNRAVGGSGGGIWHDGGAMTISNSTISGNTAAVNGGGIMIDGTVLTLTSSTVAANNALNGGGMFNNNNAILNSTIVANNGAGGNCGGKPILANLSGHNLSSDATCAFNSPGDLNNTNPLLGPLASNGSLAETHGLLPGSPAIDAVAAASCTVSTDQRGVARPQGAFCDIGAFEGVLTSCVFPPSGMVAWWPFNETAGATSLQDIIGGNNATLFASQLGAAQGPQPVPGMAGGAMNFPKLGNGLSGARVGPQGALATVGAADFTIDAWVQVPPAPANRLHYIVNKFDTGQNRGYALYIVSPGVAGSERLEFKWGDGTNVSTVQTISNLTTGQWHHVAVTFARNVGGFALDIRLYVDGVQQGQQTGNPPGLGSLVNFVFLEIGWQPGTLDEPITIDELEIFNRALRQSEIQSIVNAGSAGKCKGMPLPTGPTHIVGGGAACFPLAQPPGAFPVVNNNPSLARPLGETISGNNYSWLFEFGAFAGPVDIYLLLQLPNNLPVWFLQYPPLAVSSTAVAFMPPTLGPVSANPLFTVPYNALAGTGTYFGHVVVVPGGTNLATFSLASSPYYYWCFQRTF